MGSQLCDEAIEYKTAYVKQSSVRKLFTMMVAHLLKV